MSWPYRNLLASALSAVAVTADAQVAPARSEIAAYSGLHAAAQTDDATAIQRLTSVSIAALEMRSRPELP